MSQSLLLAMALMLILEGLMPLLMPAVWRETFKRLMTFSDGQLRFIGLSSVLIGLVLLVVSK
jgi:uncharacterized protein YjeT (DUF2065 family)